MSDSDGLIDFLQDRYIERACELIRLPVPMTKALLEGARRIRGDEAWAETARRFHRELFTQQLDRVETNKRLLATEREPGMLAAVVYLGALPQTIRYYESRGIPEQILIDTMEDMAIWMEHHRRRYGDWGLREIGWLYRHVTGGLFRLGRLQFAFMAYNRPFRAFRHRGTGQVAALCDNGVRLRADGQADGTNGIIDSEGGWTSVYTFDGRVHTGHPVTREGAAARRTVSLSAEEWELALEPGDTVWDVHIPEGSRMSHELCRQSYGEAVEFAKMYFPEQQVRAFVCTSWLLSPQFPRLLPADSNIVRFQRDYYITPVCSDESQTLERVFGFGTELADLPRLPRDTSLQRAVHDYLSAGGHIHGAAGFLLLADRGRGTDIAPIVGSDT